MSGESIAVAVVSWNTRELLRACLNSLVADVRRGGVEVWVVDNASEDGSAEMVAAEFGWANLLPLEQNVGFGPAVNEVARRSQATWIAPANADIELTGGALEALRAAGSDPTVGSVAPRLLTPGGATQHSVHAFPTIRLAALFALGAYRLPGVGDRLCIEGRWRADVPRRVDWAHGAFLLVRREAFDRVEGFDPHQWMYAEDIDLHWRLARAGWTARYEPSARVLHAVSAATSQAFGEARAERHLIATYAWLARRRGLSVAWLCALLNTAGASVRWLGAAPAAVLAPGSFAAPRDRFAGYARSHARGFRSRRALERASARPVSRTP